MKAEKPELFEHMQNTALGMYETSRYMLYNNPKQD
ncbi:hypothetical protein Dip510_000961 [Elusimicrobium posterum]